ncbi:zinc finger CCCH-type antiviral protein 1-like [Anomaloglossus baeobatrachus]|uniref:zinc finger CCCH-type antiviral protein 1-like n=1 Tax=Anomaloglossus baeobatrachus TaxID=238106 RepID=UPI003F5050A3
MSDPTATAFLTKLLCSHGGRLHKDQLSGYLKLPNEQIEQILKDKAQTFPVVGDLVLAQSPVRICPKYQKKEQERNCNKLHLCKEFLQGKCKRPHCSLHHDLLSQYNQKVLEVNEINGLNIEELKVLLLQNDRQLQPEMSEVSIGNFRMLCEVKHSQSLKLFHEAGTMENPAAISDRRENTKREDSEDAPQSKIPRIQEGSAGMPAGLAPSITSTFQQTPITTPVTTAGPVNASTVNVPMIDPLVSHAKPVLFPFQLVDLPNIQPMAPSTTGCLVDLLVSSPVPSNKPVTSWIGNPLILQPFPTIIEPNTPPATGPLIAQSSYTTLSNFPDVPLKTPVTITSPSSPQPSGHSFSFPQLCVSQPKPTTVPMGITRPAITQPVNALMNGPSISQANPVSIPVVKVSEMASPTPCGLVDCLSKGPSVQIASPSKSQLIDTFMKLCTWPKARTFKVPSSPVSQANPVLFPVPVVDVSSVPPPMVYTKRRRLVDSLYELPPVPLKKQVTTFIKSAPIHQSLVRSTQRSTPPAAVPSSAPSSCTRFKNSPTKAPSVPLKKVVKSNARSQIPIPVFSPAKPYRILDICLSNLWKYCNLGNCCPDMHYYLPYRWQVFRKVKWEDVTDMEETEKSYCDPKVDRLPLIDFLTMRSEGRRVRRLSTVSSVVKPSEYVLTTEWLWYWRDEYGTWTEYGQSNLNHVIVNVSSSDLENLYLANASAIIPFSTGENNYEINFQDMKQKNVAYKTERDVRRRPRYLSFDDVKLLKGSTRSAAAKSHLKIKSRRNVRKTGLKLEASPLNTDMYPRTWDPASMPDIGCMKVQVSKKSNRFSEIVSYFSKTVSGYKVKRIWRLQNPSLWQVFQWQKEQMKKGNQGQDVKEMRLFHGTDSRHIDAICNQNFDWRICGTHGTVYGQGSYFARDASYSHDYSPPTSGGTRAMFIARVLVGDYETGDPQMKRPPLRPGSSTRYYDSCVDNITDPSIFVVFEKHQLYPEYLLEYEEQKQKFQLQNWPY